MSGSQSDSHVVSVDLKEKSADNSMNLSFAHPRTNREDVRNWMAVGIVVGFFVFILCAFGTYWFRGQTSFDDVLKIVQVILVPVAGITGAVTEFYFGSQR